MGCASRAEVTIFYIFKCGSRASRTKLSNDAGLNPRGRHIFSKGYHLQKFCKGCERGLTNCFASGLPDLVDLGFILADKMIVLADDLNRARDLRPTRPLHGVPTAKAIDHGIHGLSMASEDTGCIQA